MDEELHNIELDRPSTAWGKSNEQIAKHTVDSQFESKPIERSLHLLRKGDDVQKLSVIQALPQLLQYDPNGTLTKIVPKIQQELPKSSCEFHIATSKIFKLLIEKQLPLNLTGAVIQGTESKDPVVSNAWIDTLLAVIPILPIEQIRGAVIPIALNKSQPSSPVYCRISSCRILGKCAAHPQMPPIDVKSLILPAVQSLCQDCFQDVRATMCAQLPFVAQGLGENLVTTSLLPSLVELASDDNMSVRSSAVASAVLIIPYLNKQTKVETIVPLIKQLCSKVGGSGDTTFPTVAREFGKLVQALQNDVDAADSLWILQLFQSLATKGQTVRLNKNNAEVSQDVICREQCAYNLPAVTLFVKTRIPNQLELWQKIFSGLASDSLYLVRKTTAGCIHEVAKILGGQCKLVKDNLIKLLRDDAEEVLQMLVPHVGLILELLCRHGVLSREQAVPACMEITKALLKCQAELSKTYNWRIKSNFLEQLESLPNCMPSDFIHQQFSPVIFNYVLEARPKPVRSQATRTLLVFLRYNLKEPQRKWIRDNLISNLCYSKSCYTRHVFIMACSHAADVFSNKYFKQYFFEPLLSLAEDPISNIRLSLVNLLPKLYRMMVLPEDKKLQTNIDNIFSKLDVAEKDKDVKDILRAKLKEIRTPASYNKQQYMTDQKRKEEEENKILEGKMTSAPGAGLQAKAVTPVSHAARGGDSASISRSQPIITRSSSAVSRSSKSSAGSGQMPSDMSFLEQHFYIDAGVSLSTNNTAINLEQPQNLDVYEINTNLPKLTATDDTKNDETHLISTVSEDTINIDLMLESELQKLETSTTNITDDVKVNLRKRSKKTNKVSSPKSFLTPPKETTLKYKRYSSVFPSTSSDTCASSGKKILNRRSLNIGIGDGSRIPVCVKKSQSNTEIKNENCSGLEASRKKIGSVSNSDVYNGKSKARPKSEVLTVSSSANKNVSVIDSNDKCTNNGCTNAINDSIIETKVPVTSINTKPIKMSGLPVLKRRTQSEARQNK